MIASRIFLNLLTALTVMLVLFGLFRLARRPFRKIDDLPNQSSKAFGAWLFGVIAMLTVSFLPSLQVMFDAWEMIYGPTTAINTPFQVKITFTESLTTAGIMILLAASWFLLWQVFSNYLVSLLGFTTRPADEMLLDNPFYFLARHAVTLLPMIVLLPFYVSILRYYLPDSKLPFYQ